MKICPNTKRLCEYTGCGPGNDCAQIPPSVASGDSMTIEDLRIIKLALGEPQLSEIKIIESVVMPDDTMVVSSKIMTLLKKHFH